MDLEDTLGRLADLLDSHGGEAATWLRSLQPLCRTDAAAAYAALNSKRVWGGAGSIANEALADNPGLRPAQWDQHVRDFRALMIDLAEHLKARGAHYPDIDFWLAAFANWQQANV